MRFSKTAATGHFGATHYENCSRVDVDDHSCSARAPLASHPRTALRVVDVPLEASRAVLFLVGTRSRSGHDHDRISSRRGRSGRLCCRYP